MGLVPDSRRNHESEGEWNSDHVVNAEQVPPCTLPLLQFGYPTLYGAYDFAHGLLVRLFSLVGLKTFQALVSFTPGDWHTGINVGIVIDE